MGRQVLEAGTSPEATVLGILRSSECIVFLLYAFFSVLRGVIATGEPLGVLPQVVTWVFWGGLLIVLESTNVRPERAG